MSPLATAPVPAAALATGRLLAGARLPIFLLVVVALGVVVVCLAVRSGRRPSPHQLPPPARPRLLDEDDDVSHIRRYEADRDGRQLPS